MRVDARFEFYHTSWICYVNVTHLGEQIPIELSDACSCVSVSLCRFSETFRVETLPESNQIGHVHSAHCEDDAASFVWLVYYP